MSDTLLLDVRTRALVLRGDPFDVRGSYEWASRVSTAISSGRDGAPIEPRRLIEYASLAALVREHTPRSLGAALREARVNESHIQRLLAVKDDREAAVRQLEKLVRLLKRRANVRDLVTTALFWGPHRARQVAQDYFGCGADE